MTKVVLVVDDEPLVLETTATMLEEQGCQVLTAESGREALRELEQQPHQKS